MDSDDVVSPALGRRQILRSAGALGLLGLTGRAPRALARREELDVPHVDGELEVGDLYDDASYQAVCTITPGQIQGPYYRGQSVQADEFRGQVASRDVRGWVIELVVPVAVFRWRRPGRRWSARAGLGAGVWSSEQCAATPDSREVCVGGGEREW